MTRNIATVNENMRSSFRPTVDISSMTVSSALFDLEDESLATDRTRSLLPDFAGTLTETLTSTNGVFSPALDTSYGLTDCWHGSEISPAFLPPGSQGTPDLVAWIRLVDATCQEAAAGNWDGEGGLPVQPGARQRAISLVTALAPGRPLPEVSVDPDGEISLGWQVDNNVLSVSVSGGGRLSYAGLFGASDVYGTEWTMDQVPAEVTHHLDRLLSAF